jgi:hypothetical protein
MVKNTTVIRLEVSTKERLDTFGKKNDSYDDVIKKLLDIADKQKSDKQRNLKEK